MVVGVTPSTWNFGSTGPRWSKVAEFQPIIARSASAVTPSILSPSSSLLSFGENYSSPCSAVSLR